MFFFLRSIRTVENSISTKYQDSGEFYQFTEVWPTRVGNSNSSPDWQDAERGTVIRLVIRTEISLLTRNFRA